MSTNYEATLTPAVPPVVPTPAGTEAKPVRKVRYIPEGYIETCTLEEWGIDIKFMPMVGRDLAQHLDRLSPLKTGLEIYDAESAMVAARLTAWSVTDEDGKAVPITPETVGGLQPVAFRTALVNRICGLS